MMTLQQKSHNLPCDEVRGDYVATPCRTAPHAHTILACMWQSGKVAKCSKWELAGTRISDISTAATWKAAPTPQQTGNGTCLRLAAASFTITQLFTCTCQHVGQRLAQLEVALPAADISRRKALLSRVSVHHSKPCVSVGHARQRKARQQQQTHLGNTAKCSGAKPLYRVMPSLHAPASSSSLTAAALWVAAATCSADQPSTSSV